MYFPNGKSMFNNLNLDDLITYMATFAGVIVKEMIEGVPRTAGEYFENIKTSPVRLYLHTEMKVILCFIYNLILAWLNIYM